MGREVDPRSTTLLALSYARTGSMLRAARVLAFVIAWDATRQELGRAPGVEEYAGIWGEDRATVYRHLELFHVVFPNAATPDAVLEVLARSGAGVRERCDLAAVAA